MALSSDCCFTRWPPPVAHIRCQTEHEDRPHRQSLSLGNRLQLTALSRPAAWKGKGRSTRLLRGAAAGPFQLLISTVKRLEPGLPFPSQGADDAADAGHWVEAEEARARRWHEVGARPSLTKETLALAVATAENERNARILPRRRTASAGRAAPVANTPAPNSARSSNRLTCGETPLRELP